MKQIDWLNKIHSWQSIWHVKSCSTIANNGLCFGRHDLTNSNSSKQSQLNKN